LDEIWQIGFVMPPSHLVPASETVPNAMNILRRYRMFGVLTRLVNPGFSDSSFYNCPVYTG
jgi:hypothetical protein